MSDHTIEITKTAAELAARPDPRDSRLRAERNATIYDFYEYLYKIMKVVKPNVLFMPAYPAYIREGALVEDDFTDTITYKIRRREPGTIANHPFDTRKEIKPRIREENVPDEDNPGFYYDEYAQWFDNLIQFDIWSMTNTGAEELSQWFEEFMFMSTGVLEEYGVQKIYFYRQEEDETFLQFDHRLQRRTLLYYVRTEKIWQRRG